VQLGSNSSDGGSTSKPARVVRAAVSGLGKTLGTVVRAFALHAATLPVIERNFVRLACADLVRDHHTVGGAGGDDDGCDSDSQNAPPASAVDGACQHMVTWLLFVTLACLSHVVCPPAHC
jgi:hypothetical protein